MYLNCKTYFSLRYGTIPTPELVNLAAGNGISALALANINSTTDSWEFVRLCKNRKIKPILGSEIRNGDRLLYVLIAANNKGFQWINQFLSHHHQNNLSFPLHSDQEPFFLDSWDGFVIYPLSNLPNKKLMTNEWIGVSSSELTKIHPATCPFAHRKIVIRQPITFCQSNDQQLHRILRAIDKNCLLSKLPPGSCNNEIFLPPHEILHAFRHDADIVTNTCRLIDSCSIDMDFSLDKTKKIFGQSISDDRELLRKLAHEGMTHRYGHSKNIAEVQKELEIINQMGFNAYFLIAWDIVRYAKSKGYYHVGRGSGANSIVAYCIGITDVDPIELGLYFERFLNPHRSSPPDFDIDFSWKDRDDVIEYVFRRYGSEHTALLGTHVTFQYNSLVREIGKVLGLPSLEMDQLVEKGYFKQDGFARLKQADHLKKAILFYGKRLQHFPDNLSVHPGGILISERPILEYSSLHLPPKGFPTTALNMHMAGEIGLYKLDILSQRGLGHIKDCLQLINKNQNAKVNIHDIERFKKNDTICDHIRHGKTIGCFYVESPAMRHVLKKLRCEDYLTLVAASSIIRPGVGRSGMMNEYIRRFHHPNDFRFLHPDLEPLLKETFGILVYQEDVIRVAHFWAGLTMADADMLRRATTFKYHARDKMTELKSKFFESCQNRGYSLEIVNEVWRQIESFAEFSFCKAHSASFAIESYQSLYLKAHFPMEFMVAVINNFGGFYNHENRELYFYELIKTGASVYPPCVNHSDYLTNIHGTEVYVGFIQIKGLEQKVAETVVNIRVSSGRYHSLTDFLERTCITKEQAILLIRVGALRFTEKNKKYLLWEIDFYYSRRQRRPHQLPFYQSTKVFRIPDLPQYRMDDLYDEVELLGFPVCNPFTLVDDDPASYPSASELPGLINEHVTLLGYHINQKPVKTIHGHVMSFGSFVDHNLDWIDTVHFPDIYKKIPPQAGFYRLSGIVKEEFGVVTLEVKDIEKVPVKKRRHIYDGHSAKNSSS